MSATTWHLESLLVTSIHCPSGLVLIVIPQAKEMRQILLEAAQDVCLIMQALIVCVKVLPYILSHIS